MKTYSLEEITDETFGPVGTPKRDEMERRLAEELHAYRIGEAIKKARTEQNLTQEELGERIGVGRARISKMEKGYNITTEKRKAKKFGRVLQMHRKRFFTPI